MHVVVEILYSWYPKVAPNLGNYYSDQINWPVHQNVSRWAYFFLGNKIFKFSTNLKIADYNTEIEKCTIISEVLHATGNLENLFFRLEHLGTSVQWLLSICDVVIVFSISLMRNVSPFSNIQMILQFRFPLRIPMVIFLCNPRNYEVNKPYKRPHRFYCQSISIWT